MSDTTSETVQESERTSEFMSPAVDMARDAGVPELFDDNTAVFLHRTAAGSGYVLVAFDPQVLIRWADTSGFKLKGAAINFLPMGMPVLSVELEDLDATQNREDKASDQD